MGAPGIEAGEGVPRANRVHLQVYLSEQGFLGSESATDPASSMALHGCFRISAGWLEPVYGMGDAVRCAE